MAGVVAALAVALAVLGAWAVLHRHAQRRRVRDLFTAVGDRLGEGTAARDLGIDLWAARRLDEAIEALDGAAVSYAKAGDHHWQAIVRRIATEVRRQRGTAHRSR